MTALRVLIVSHTYTAPINHAKLRALAARVTLTAVVPSRWRDALFELEALPQQAGYALHALPILGSGHILRYVFSPLALWRIARRARPHLVYVEAEPPSLALAQWAWLKRGLGFRLVGFTWENIARGGGLPGVERYNLARCDGMVAGNQAAAALLRRKGYAGRLRVTPQLGVDPDTFRPEAAGALRERLGLAGLVVGYVGRLVEAKGLHVLMEAVDGLAGAQLLLVGDGPLRPRLEAWTAQAPGRACLLDAVPHEEVPGLLRGADVLVLPSLTTPAWKEQFGHVLIEAMASGVPVIGSSSGAIPEVIGEAGLIVPEGDSAALRAAIVALQADPARRDRLAQAGRERVLAHYTHARIAAQNVEFFHDVLAP